MIRRFAFGKRNASEVLRNPMRWSFIRVLVALFFHIPHHLTTLQMKGKKHNRSSCEITKYAADYSQSLGRNPFARKPAS